MKNIFKKQNLMPVIVLSCICLVVAVLMGVVNMFTAPRIQFNEEQKVYESLKVVLDGTFEPKELPQNIPSTVTGLYEVTEGDEIIGHVVTLEQQGYADKILLTVGIDKDGKITKVVITGQQETHGKDISPLIDRFASVTEDQVADVEHVSGASLTSGYIKDAIADAFKVINADVSSDDGDNEDNESDAEPETLPRTDEELVALSKELIGKDVELSDVTPENTTNVKRVYRASGNNGYVAYVYTISAHYGNVDTENLVYIGNNGAIKDIKKLTWSVSDAAPDLGYDPPSDEKLTEFYNGLIGKNSSNIGDVDLTTGATNTTTTLVNTVTEALKVANEFISKDLPRQEAEIKALVVELLGEGTSLTDITPDGVSLVKKVYRADGGKGYAVYVATISAHYGTVDTENIVHIGTDGTIKSIKKLTWSVSDAAPDLGYDPPSDEKLTEFYNGLIGKNSSNIGDVDLATGATNTTTTLVNTVTEALNVVDEIIKNDLPRSEDEIEKNALELVGDGEILVNITPADATLVRRLYRLESGKGYVAYLVAISPNYGTVETETLVYIDSNGNIASIKSLMWKVSDPAPDWGYNPPNDERVNQLYNDFVGKNLDTVGEVDLKTGATATGTRLLECVTKALEIVDPFIESVPEEVPEENNTARIIGIVALSVMVIAMTTCIVVPKLNKGGKANEQ